LLAAIEISSDPTSDHQVAKDLEDRNGTIERLNEAAKKSDYQVENC